MWGKIINNEKKKEYFQKIFTFLKEQQYKGKQIFPLGKDIFNAFKLTPWAKIKVVILGQDPYPGANQAHGLAFSVCNLKTPYSLQNIFKELQNDLFLKAHNNNLSSWAREGVLLLNVILTVEKNNPLSHKNIGWEEFTKNILQFLQKKDKIVYILWGKFAQNYKKYIDQHRNYIIQSAHPSPLSADKGFFGSKPFSKTNQYLIKNNIPPINWALN
ncbi:uracil-DNA glycosylase [Candidatus Phytoplasma melaleucae]|uniref:Uracil-DNA glycosylase n=1 Tax=Candidatus Phytoplasma melaleucae TaxID=2982630 RepID=A0ABT9DDV9_9MOLU|nr:uracil-DNA glycosylase ['Melaleuca sp.' phytoplasma]MDO8168212.1 uracil-DNA glycosylase ['Melaleuca sp.' phytoplasma]